MSAHSTLLEWGLIGGKGVRLGVFVLQEFWLQLADALDVGCGSAGGSACTALCLDKGREGGWLSVSVCAFQPSAIPVAAHPTGEAWQLVRQSSIGENKD